MNRCAIVLVVVAAGCTGLGASAARRLADDSSVPVLVPDDAAYADTWEFTLEDGPDNYTLRSNWSPAFDTAVDRDRTIVGYQIGDPTTWSGEPPAEDEATRDAFVAVLADATQPSSNAPCSNTSGEPLVVACTYDVGQGEPLRLLVREFDIDGQPVDLIVLDTAAADDFIAGSFTTYPIADAIDTWFSD